MKTIAISIEEQMVSSLDRLAHASDVPRMSRSAIVRRALSEYLARHEQALREEHERKVISKNKELLNRQAEALVAEQAEL